MLMTTEKLWETFHTGLKHFILQRVPDEQSADDVLQETFLKIHTHIDTLRDADRLQGWMYQIARNAIADYYRQQKATVALSEALPIPEEPVVEDEVIKSLIPSVKAMVESLPPAYREALILTEYEGLSQRELAQKLGLSFSGAKSRVQRAREKLKVMLLDCCHFEFDRLGKIIDYEPNCACCTDGGCGEGSSYRHSPGTQSNPLACHSERSEESACRREGFFAALRMTGEGVLDL